MTLEIYRPISYALTSDFSKTAGKPCWLVDVRRFVGFLKLYFGSPFGHRPHCLFFALVVAQLSSFCSFRKRAVNLTCFVASLFFHQRGLNVPLKL